jgi:protein-tyrosine phosphatase
VGEQQPALAVHLTGRPTPATSWERLWVRWPDFWVPTDPGVASTALQRAHRLAAEARVEIACTGGVGRTGTGLAALCVLDGLDPDAAVTWVRSRYHPRAVEVPWHRRFLRYVAARVPPR